MLQRHSGDRIDIQKMVQRHSGERIDFQKMLQRHSGYRIRADQMPVQLSCCLFFSGWFVGARGPNNVPKIGQKMKISDQDIICLYLNIYLSNYVDNVT